MLLTDAFLPARVLMSNEDEEEARTGNEAREVRERRNRIGKEAYLMFMVFERVVIRTALKLPVHHARPLSAEFLRWIGQKRDLLRWETLLTLVLSQT